ncbi:hypothetical protein BKA93DRAFT_826630 [Sparassis latifolia]|uniref:Fungal-type protein kinase domain-containing protein n=1 Tax=Sparassis crispa TaxID=139825 RepID=A0A401GXA9_9APHY|nr:hypothetical protein SCP_1001070 [Sparassis crispa]GBE86865.1 hypothetical protein SCP_1001070 [Sparassis crispa]
MPMKQRVDDGRTVWERTWTVYPSKMIPVLPKRLRHFEDGFELVLLVYHALCAHQEYYKAGVLHGNVSEENVIIFETPFSERKGVLVDLDQANTFRRPERPDPDLKARNV